MIARLFRLRHRPLTTDPDPYTHLDRLDGLDSRRPATRPVPHVPSTAELDLIERANKRLVPMIARQGMSPEVLATMARYDRMVAAVRAGLAPAEERAA